MIMIMVIIIIIVKTCTILKVLEVCPDIPAACSDYNSLPCHREEMMCMMGLATGVLKSTYFTLLQWSWVWLHQACLRLAAGENVLLGGNLMWWKEKRKYKQQHTHTHQQALYTQNYCIWNCLPRIHSCSMTPHTITHLPWLLATFVAFPSCSALIFHCWGDCSFLVGKRCH